MSVFRFYDRFIIIKIWCLINKFSIQEIINIIKIDFLVLFLLSASLSSSNRDRRFNRTFSKMSAGAHYTGISSIVWFGRSRWFKGENRLIIWDFICEAFNRSFSFLYLLFLIKYSFPLLLYFLFVLIYFFFVSYNFYISEFNFLLLNYPNFL